MPQNRLITLGFLNTKQYGIILKSEKVHFVDFFYPGKQVYVESSLLPTLGIVGGLFSPAHTGNSLYYFWHFPVHLTKLIQTDLLNSNIKWAIWNINIFFDSLLVPTTLVVKIFPSVHGRKYFLFGRPQKREPMDGFPFFPFLKNKTKKSKQIVNIQYNLYQKVERVKYYHEEKLIRELIA